MKLRIGSRDSKLAVIQSELIIATLQKYHPDLETELITMKTTGDRILDRTLDQIGGKGLFVKELDQALLDGRVDITVHSLKDLPMEVDPRLPVVAYSKREDPRDVLVLPMGATSVPEGLPIGCSSRRRGLQLKTLFPGCQVKSVRGNVLTRLAKLDSGEYGALVLAAAGLHRLGLQDRISRYLSVEEMLPAAGQGIMAVQTRWDFDPAVLACINDKDSRACALAERAFVHALDGGCSSPVAGYATVSDGNLSLRGLYVSPDGKTVRRGCVFGKVDQARALGVSLAMNLMEGAL